MLNTIIWLLPRFCMLRFLLLKLKRYIRRKQRRDQEAQKHAQAQPQSTENSQ